MKKKTLQYLWIGIFAAGFLCLHLWMKANAPVFSVDYTLPLPDGYRLDVDNRTRNASILSGEEVIGGIIHCPYQKSTLGTVDPSAIHMFSFNQYFSIILETLQDGKVPGADRDAFDMMLDSRTYADCGLWSGNQTEEYEHLLYFFEDGIVTLWFDAAKIDDALAFDMESRFLIAR